MSKMIRIIDSAKIIKLDSHCFLLCRYQGDCQKCPNYNDCCDYFGLIDPASAVLSTDGYFFY